MLMEVLDKQNEEERGGVDGIGGLSNTPDEGSTGWDVCHHAIGPV
jgi:hypothetical protein